jgi:putative sterol carrier protein
VGEETTISDLIDLLCRSFQPDRSVGFDVTVQVHLEGEKGGDWIVLIKDQTCTAVPGIAENSKIKVEAAAQDVLDIFNGKLDPMRAFMLGKLKLSGDKALALKMITLFKLA